MLIKKVLALVLSLALFVSMTACGEKNGGSSNGGKDGKPYVAVVSKGFQHQFWQIVKRGLVRLLQIWALLSPLNGLRQRAM